jgi:hypothetical protein
MARALDEGQLALAQIYGLHIPIGELDDRRLSQLSRLTAFARPGFNPDEPRVPKGDPRGGEWTTGGDDEGPGATSYSTPSGSGAGDEGGDDAGGSGLSASPAPTDLGAGDSGGGDGGGDGGTAAGDSGFRAPEPIGGTGDASPQNPPVSPATPVSPGEPAISFTIVEPQDGAPSSGPPSTTTASCPRSRCCRRSIAPTSATRLRSRPSRPRLPVRSNPALARFPMEKAARLRRRETLRLSPNH